MWSYKAQAFRARKLCHFYFNKVCYCKIRTLMHVCSSPDTSSLASRLTTMSFDDDNNTFMRVTKIT